MILSGLDICLVIILVLFSFIGLIRGFLKELSSIVNWAGSFYFVAITKPVILPIVENKITIPLLPDIVVNVILFIFYMVVLSIFMNFIVNNLRKILPVSTNGLLGFVFGALKGILISIFILTGMNIINENSNKKLETLENLALHTYFSKSKNGIFNSIMESLLGDFLKELQKNKTSEIIEDIIEENSMNIKNENNKEDIEKLINILVVD